MFDIAVIGAGVVGAMVAHELAKYDVSICILEKESDVAMGATRANSAIVHAGFDAAVGSLKAKFNVQGSKMMQKVCQDLGVKYKNNGSLVVGFDQTDRQTLQNLLERGVANGVEGLMILERDEILKLEPNIGKEVKYALHAPTGAIVCPYELALAGVGNAMDNGAELLCDFEVKSIEKKDGFFEISSDSAKIEAKYVVNCAGVYSDTVASMVADIDFDVHARRGEYMLLDKSCGSLVSHTIFCTPSVMGKGILVSPTVDGNLLLGPTAQDIDDKTDTKTTVEGLASVRAQATRNVDGINFSKVITSFTGLRSVGSTHDFIINAKEGFVNCAGIESPGLSASPAIALYVSQLLFDMGMTKEPRKDHIATREALHAFSEMSIEQKNEVIKSDPRYAHIICRCESVTEGEIVKALTTNPKPRDLDGVKRRTRSGMGRCQGGFCMPYVMELIAKHTGTPYDQIQKGRAGSNILVGKTDKGVRE